MFLEGRFDPAGSAPTRRAKIPSDHGRPPARRGGGNLEAVDRARRALDWTVSGIARLSASARRRSFPDTLSVVSAPDWINERTASSRKKGFPSAGPECATAALRVRRPVHGPGPIRSQFPAHELATSCSTVAG